MDELVEATDGGGKGDCAAHREEVDEHKANRNRPRLAGQGAARGVVVVVHDLIKVKDGQSQGKEDLRANGQKANALLALAAALFSIVIDRITQGSKAGTGWAQDRHVRKRA